MGNEKEGDVVEGVRHRITLSGATMYAVIVPDEHEIFLSGEQVTGERDLLCIGLSKLWQSEGLESLVRQLKKTSPTVEENLPGKILEVLLKTVGVD